MTAEMHTNIFPNVFRILVIDDQICSDYACQKQVDKDSDSAHVKNLIRCYYRSVVQRVALGQKTKGIIKAELPQIEVVFAKDPDEGVGRWMESVYDLTLVDSDFSRDETMMQKLDDRQKRNFLDLKLEFAGAYLYRFLYELLLGNDFGNARKGCRVALWTGLGLANENRAKRLISILPSVDEGLCFIPKKEDDVGGWRKMLGLGENAPMTIGGIIGEMANDNPVLNPGTSYVNDKAKSDAIIGRIKGLYRIKTPETFASLCGLAEPVYVGWLKAEDGGVFLYDKLPDGNHPDRSIISLSPLLRRGEDIDDCVVTASDSEDIKTRKKEKAKRWEVLIDIGRGQSGNGIVVPDAKPQTADEQKRKKHIIAAATPLTGCSAVGKDSAIDLMVKKIAALLDGPFGQVVLKTVYLDSPEQWNNLHWPTLQAQSHHRTRCLRSTAHPRTLWNTGITALESFTPEMMNNFLGQFAKVNAAKCKKIIVSLGSKFPQWNLNVKKRNGERQASGDAEKAEPLKAYRNHILNFSKHIEEFRTDLETIWKKLFLEVFDGNNMLKGPNQYPIVEINVRHYLRESVAYHLGGHEYLSPAKIDPNRTKDELDFTGCYYFIDLEFKAWLGVLDKTAKDFDKKLLLKLPFRGDLLHFIRLIRDYVEGHKGTTITGITLINAFKSGVVESEHGVTYSPAWYGRLDAWNDVAGRKWTYQMSGELLAASRNELLGEVLNLVESSNLDVHISGGIVDAEGIRYCSPMVVHTIKCQRCGKCADVCNEQAITVVKGQTPAVIDQSKCVLCKKCIEECPFKAIGIPVQIGTWALMDLNLGESKWLSCPNVPPSIGNGRPMVTGCKKCTTICYVQCRSDAFLKGSNNNEARIDIGKCVECKECLRMCPHGAITLGINNAKSTPHDDSGNRGGNKRINPRIAFYLHELCNGCGKCSRTFYCDTFMERRGLELPPVMNSRNCTGCGLCVQTCPRGAIQLFSPEHVVALIGTGNSLTTWHRRLTAYEIPHLVFSKDEVENYYKKWETDSFAKQMEEIWKYRIEHDLFFDRILPDDYTDDRKWSEFEKSVLKKVSNDDIIQKWLFLAWSDPGQVLKDSPVICAATADFCCYFDEDSSKPDCGLLLQEVLNHSRMMQISQEVNKRLNNLREVK